MKKIKKILFNCILIAFLHSCGSGSDAAKVLKNEKIKKTDEFLVKKRDPLILPPEYNTLPKPNSVEQSKKIDGNEINKILKLPDEQTSTTKGSSSIEESIMKNIRK